MDVNISGYIYHIDQDAYEKLQRYISSLEKHYGNNEEAKEIVKDIEQRISELLNEKKLSDNIVFSIEDIERIINILGTPEDIFGDIDEEDSSETRYKVRKKLYRDNDKRIFGGVSAGLAAYLGIPVLLIRTALVILILVGYGLPFVIYIVMWATIPKAITPTQRLEMKGEPVNVENIEKTIKKEYEDVRDNIKHSSPKIKSFISKTGDIIYDIFQTSGNILRLLIGIGLIGFGIIVIISIISSLFLASTFIIPFNDLHFINILPDLLLNSANLTLFYISFCLVVCIPFVLITYLGLKMLLRLKTGGAAVVLTCIAFWIFGIVNIAIIGSNQFKNFKESAESYKVATNLEPTSKNIIYLANTDNVKEHDDDSIEINNIFISNENGYTLLHGKPQIKFELTETSNYELIVKKVAKSKTKKEAFEATEDISYHWTLQDSVLHIDRFFKIKNNIKWKKQRVNLSIKIPVNKGIVLDKYMYESSELSHENFKNFYRHFNSNSPWIMNEKGQLINEDDQL